MTVSANTIYRGVGVSQFPYSDTDVDSVQLSITDAAQDTLLALFKAAINDELSGAFLKANSNTILAGRIPVQDVWPGQLTPQVMKERKTSFPILAVYPTGPATWTQRTMGVLQRNRDWGIDYVLGPLNAGDQQSLGRILTKVDALLQLVLWQRGHKAYQSGATQFGDLNSLQWAFIESSEMGQAKFAGDDGGVIYYGLSAKMTTLEYDSDSNPYSPLTGTTFTLGMGSPDGVLPDEIIALTTGAFLGSAFSNGFQIQGI